MQNPLGLYPLPRPDGLTTEEAIHLLRSPSDDIVIVPCIPEGAKNNVYCLIDNSRNQQRQTLGQNSTFDDDSGAWQASKSKSAIAPYVSDGGNGLKRIFWIASQQAYCNEVKVDGKRTYTPLDPQPSPDAVIKIRRYYVTLAANDEYKRRITTLVEQNVMAEHNVAIVEYFGENTVSSVHDQSKDMNCGNQSTYSGLNTMIPPAQPVDDTGSPCESSDSSTVEMQTSLGVYPLPHPNGLTTEEAFQLLQSPTDNVAVLPQIPKGTKRNIYCLIDNSKNQKRRTFGHRGIYDDDCGPWQTSKSSCVISPYVVDNQNRLKRIFWVVSQQAYCSEVKVDGKRVYNPLNPQPSPDTVIKFKRYYVTLAADDEYKRRITTLVGPSVTADHNVAIVEYFDHNDLHGHCKDVKYGSRSPKNCPSIMKSHAEPVEEIANNAESNDSCTAETQAQFGLYALPGPDGLSTEEAIQLLRAPAQNVVVLQQIPKGTKNNVYCLIDISESLKKPNFSCNNNRIFDDDCGPWQTSKSKCATSPYVVDRQNGLKRIFWVASQQAYCSEVKVDGKRVYNPMNPQPLPDTVIKVKRYYVTLAANDEYKRRITTLVEPSTTAEHNVAIVEYFGVHEPDAVHSTNDVGHEEDADAAVVRDEIVKDSQSHENSVEKRECKNLGELQSDAPVLLDGDLMSCAEMPLQQEPLCILDTDQHSTEVK